MISVSLTAKRLIHMKTFYVVCVVFVISRGGIMKRNARTSAPARKMNVASYEENLSAIIPDLKRKRNNEK